MSNVQNINVVNADAGVRLDRFLKKKFSEIPHTMIEKWCRKGNLRVDGKRVKASFILKTGQVVRLPPLPSFEKNSKPRYVFTNEDKKLLKEMILYEDSHLMILNKPAGLAVQGGTGTYRHVDGLLSLFQNETASKPHLVHRLDRDTSGVLVVAKTPQDAQWLTRAFKEKSIQKVYWALVVGVPDPQEQTITLALAKATSGDKEKVEITPTGKSAITHLKVLDHAAKIASWVELVPETGRTHQLRAHCQAINHPILGDRKYGGKSAQPFNEPLKMHLHARSLRVVYPDGTSRCFKAPVPEHMIRLFLKLGFSSRSSLS